MLAQGAFGHFQKEFKEFVPVEIGSSAEERAGFASVSMRRPSGEHPTDNGRIEFSIRIRLERKYAVKGQLDVWME